MNKVLRNPRTGRMMKHTMLNYIKAFCTRVMIKLENWMK